MLSTLLQNQIYLGFIQAEPLQQTTFQKTFLGGHPIFLEQPLFSLLECASCNKQKLTFICQIFCPLQAERCYNRVLYVFYCEKCYRFFRTIKQQTSADKKIQKIQSSMRVISQKSFEIDSQGFDVKDLMKIIHRSRLQVQQEIKQQAEQQQFDDQQEFTEQKDVQIQEIQDMGFNKYDQNGLGGQLQKQQFQSLKQATETLNDKKEEKDPIFQQYKKIMLQLDGPVLLYSNIPLAYNNQPINNKHFCKFCNGKLTLQLQLTQKILSCSAKLVGMDWGSLMVFTCSNSCQKSIEECVVVQYQIDAIKDSEISVLKKRNKNKKRKDKKQKSKSKEHANQFKKEEVIEEEGNEQGDWD